MLAFGSVHDLIALALALGARGVEGWSESEDSAVHALPAVPPNILSAARQAILRGEDPLGDMFCGRLTAEQRRPLGATYTPKAVITAMLAWAATQIDPARIVDPGAGSARFLVAAGRTFPTAQLVAVEIDPLAATLARGHLAAAGMRNRSQVIVGDYRESVLAQIDGPTLYLGNPPYVRHHLVSKTWKTWLTETARAHGFLASQLAGLHVHFFLAIANSARKGDVGALITAAEWLDVNYGRLVRELLVGPLGVKTIHVIEPAAMPFLDAATTAVITGFEVGSRPMSIGLRRVETLGKLEGLSTDWHVRRERLEQADRWTPLTRPAQGTPAGFIELGELCRVHRGQVTGANNIWIVGSHARDLPKSVLFHTVTRARELFAVNGVLDDPLGLRMVIDLPVDLDVFNTVERNQINKFLRFAKSSGADGGFIASHRKAWWSVGLREPAPILATYMARRPPAFIRNLANARHINIAHGLYPREPLTEAVLRGLGTFLSRHTSLNQGRAYAGGLTKFEPREMERLKVPRPELLSDVQFLETLL